MPRPERERYEPDCALKSRGQKSQLGTLLTERNQSPQRSSCADLFFLVILSGKYSDGNCRDDEIGERGGQKHFPSQAHDLIVAESGQGPADQNKQPAKKDDFRQESDYLQRDDDELRNHEVAAPRKMEPVAKQKRNLPAAEKEGCDEAGRRHHLGKLAGKEHEKLAARILGMETCNEFRFSFRKVERHPFRLCYGCG